MKQKTPKQLKAKLWKVFSEYIRRRDSGTCFTCGKQMNWKEAHAGHYIPQSVGGLELRFHPYNVHAQCVGCNMFRHGNLTMYALRLQEKYGKEILSQLDFMKGIKHWSRDQFERRIKLYKSLTKEL